MTLISGDALIPTLLLECCHGWAELLCMEDAYGNVSPEDPRAQKIMGKIAESQTILNDSFGLLVRYDYASRIVSTSRVSECCGACRHNLLHQSLQRNFMLLPIHMMTKSLNDFLASIEEHREGGTVFSDLVDFAHKVSTGESYGI